MKQQHIWFCQQSELHKVALYRLAYSILHNEEDAKDAVAEAIYRAFSKLDTLRQPEQFKAWLLRIVANESYTALKRRSRLVSLEEWGADIPAPPASEEHGLWPLVQALPDTLRAPITLFYYDGFSVREIAQILNLSEGAVKTRLSRGRQLLKEILEKEDAR